MKVKMIFDLEIDESLYPYLSKKAIRKMAREEEGGTLSDYISNIMRVQLDCENAMIATGFDPFALPDPEEYEQPEEIVDDESTVQGHEEEHVEDESKAYTVIGQMGESKDREILKSDFKELRKSLADSFMVKGPITVSERLEQLKSGGIQS